MSRRHPSPLITGATRKQGDGGLNSQTFLSGVGVQAALAGYTAGTPGRQNNGGVPYLQPSIFSPKSQAGGRINSEPPTPTSNGRPSASTPARAPSGSVGSPKLGSGYNPISTSNSTPNRRNSGQLSSTAPAGSLAGIARLVETSARGGAAGAAVTGSAYGQRTGVGLGGAGLSATLPSSRPGTAGQSALTTTGSRPGTGANGRAAAGTVPGLMFSVGSNQSMGSRGYQEDYRSIADTTSTPGLSHLPNVLLGAAVYDGHGGKQVSHWLSSSYCLLNRAMEAVQSLVSGGGSPNEVAGVMEDVFGACGSAAIAGRMSAGSCVALALLLQAGGVPWVLSANVGDSRTVLVGWDEEGGPAARPDAVQMSIDHKLGPAKSSEETRRVQAAGGTVIQLFGTWRIDGSLAVARAIGDCDFSRYVSYKPTVLCRQLTRRDRWIIIASDGLWDVMTNEEVALFCKAQHQLSAAKLSEALVREAVRNRGSGDNTTVVAVRLQYNPPAAPPASPQ